MFRHVQGAWCELNTIIVNNYLMARIVIVAERGKDESCLYDPFMSIRVGDDKEYHSWVSNGIQEYIATRSTPYNIVFALGNDEQVHVIILV